MGGNSSSRSASFDPDDAEGVTLVKGIRLTDRVIDRMRESPAAGDSNQSKSRERPSFVRSSTPLGDTGSLGERLTPILPHPSFASSRVPPPYREPMAPLMPPVSETQKSPATSSPGASPARVVGPVPHPPHELVDASAQENLVKSPPLCPTCPPSEPLPMTTNPASEPEVASPPSLTEPVVITNPEAVDASPPEDETVTYQLHTELSTTPFKATSMSQPPDTEITSPASSPSVLASEPISTTETSHSSDGPWVSHAINPLEATSEILLTPDEPSDLTGTSHFSPSSGPEELIDQEHSSALAATSELPSISQTALPPPEEIPTPSNPSPASGPTAKITGLLATHQQAAVNEEELRKRIRDELQELLREEINIAKLKIQQQLEEEEASAKAEAQAKAQLQIQAKVQEIVEREQAALQQSLKDAIMKERMKTEKQRLAAQYYWMERKIQKLEEKEKEIATKDSLYREQITKLNEKTAQITRVTAENFKKGLEDTQKHFKRYQIKPVCSKLQSEIMKCYRENTGQTLICSNIASLYLQCVNRAKQDKLLNTGG